MMELPKFGDQEAVLAALEKLDGEMREATGEVKRLLAMKRAVRSMCRHEMESDGDAHFPTSRCKVCGHSPGGRLQVTIYEN